jgi:hypothetical protein
VEYLTVKNFSKFQHYKERNPPWIKIHRELFLDYEFGRLQDASKLHLILIWLLASQKDNKFPNDPEYIKEQIHVKEDVDLNLLISKGFLIPLASCKQDASTLPTNADSEAEAEAETEAETETDEHVFPKQTKKKRERKYDEDDLEFAEKMATDISSWSSTFKTPDYETWADEIRKFRKNEKTTLKLIRQTWTAIQADSPCKQKIGSGWKGWRSVVMSPTKFRKQYVQVRSSLNLDSKSVQNNTNGKASFVTA